MSRSLFDSLDGEKRIANAEILREPDDREGMVSREWSGREKELLLTLLAGTPDLIYFKDRKRRFVLASHSFCRLFGLDMGRVLGKTDEALFPKEIAAESTLDDRRVIEEGQSITNKEEGGELREGTETWLLTSKLPWRDPQGNIIGLFGISRDITEQRRTKAPLKRSEPRLRSLAETVGVGHEFEEIIGNSAPMMATLHKVEQVAATDATVLLLGETGTGKDLLARAIHARSSRKGRPFIKVDCTTLPSGLIESELFGHEKGAFTGAHQSKSGRFELAESGTIFLDEIAELSSDLQAKLLRVIQDGEFQRLGAKRNRRVDVRVVAATNRDLHKEMRTGRFRADLYYRIGVFPIEVPPLRDRLEDIPLLTSFFVSQKSKKLGRKVDRVPRATRDALTAYDWPGNVRELQNVVERAIILSTGRELELSEPLGRTLPPMSAAAGSLPRNLRGIERRQIVGALEASGWKIKGEGNAASRLGLKPSTLRSRMKRLGIERPD